MRTRGVRCGKGAPLVASLLVVVCVSPSARPSPADVFIDAGEANVPPRMTVRCFAVHLLVSSAVSSLSVPGRWWCLEGRCLALRLTLVRGVRRPHTRLDKSLSLLCRLWFADHALVFCFFFVTPPYPGRDRMCRTAQVFVFHGDALGVGAGAKLGSHNFLTGPSSGVEQVFCEVEVSGTVISGLAVAGMPRIPRRMEASAFSGFRCRPLASGASSAVLLCPHRSARLRWNADFSSVR